MDARHLTFFGLLLMCSLTSESADALRTYYMDDLCRFSTTATISVGSPTSGSYASSGILKATSSRRYDSGKQCVVTLNPGVNNIVIAIRKIDLRLGCIDKLTLSGGSFGRKIVYCSDYSDYNEWRVFQSTFSATVNFTTGNNPFSTTYSGFELVFTSYSNIPCAYNEYKCDNYRCINKDLRCDGHNHCGDRSDQDYCGMSTGGIVGTVFGLIFLAIAVIAGIVYCRGRQRRIITTSYQTPQQQIYTNPTPSQPATGIYPPAYQESRPPMYQGNYQPSYQSNVLPSPVHMGSPVTAGKGKN